MGATDMDRNLDLLASANNINQLHQQATKCANDAIDYAEQAGRLLLAAKESLPHGEFGKWINQNLLISKRQAQRYIEAYKGKKQKVSSLPKSDVMSDSDREHFFERLNSPQWIPEAGTWYSAGLSIGGFWVVPDSKFLNTFHISKFSVPPGIDTSRCDLEWTPTYSCTKHSVDADKVESTLIFFGLNDPKSVIWDIHKAPGQSLPFGQFEDDSDSYAPIKGSNDA